MNKYLKSLLILLSIHSLAFGDLTSTDKFKESFGIYKTNSKTNSLTLLDQLGIEDDLLKTEIKSYWDKNHIENFPEIKFEHDKFTINSTVVENFKSTKTGFNYDINGKTFFYNFDQSFEANLSNINLSTKTSWFHFIINNANAQLIEGLAVVAGVSIILAIVIKDKIDDFREQTKAITVMNHLKHKLEWAKKLCEYHNSDKKPENFDTISELMSAFNQTTESYNADCRDFHKKYANVSKEILQEVKYTCDELSSPKKCYKNIIDNSARGNKNLPKINYDEKKDLFILSK